MTALSSAAEAVIGISPFGEPNARLVAAICAAGGLGVLDLGTGDRRARQELARAGRWPPGPFGVRLGGSCALDPVELAGEGADISTVVLDADARWRPAELRSRFRVLVEVTSSEEALRAVRDGAHGLVARGCECGGRIGELTTFVLLQQLLSAEAVDVPIWACGGIGPRSAAAAVVGGAAGVVLDTQLALLAESNVPGEVAAAIRTMDGSETTVVDGFRVLRRRGHDAVPDPEGPDVRGRLGARDLRAQLLPIGQDGFLAARFAEQWGDAGTAVRAVTEAIHDAVRGDALAEVLVPDSPMSRALGTSLPVVQGPMTRVSDQALFAEQVAAEGGLPFIALALADREQTLALLEQTRDVLGGRPWGVGVLGFAPEEIRAAQLEVIRAIRPPCAIVAGGRPSQASALEEVGIEAFLHVPSAGLLKQFLDAGARKFVFEGAECGGHVGPRASFPLWEAQIDVLIKYLDGTSESADGLRVLFAGGIHDSRSAAMVAALASPLAARGVAIGVLMGTAYLLTEQAVSCGAIEPVFQDQVVTARQTVLLETAPGHATRCVRSPFTDTFLAVKDELREQGATDRQVWETLESLNLGRLRLASKGIERVGDTLARVDRDRQVAEGLFMAGQVAALRGEVTTIRALHESVSTAAAAYFVRRAADLRTRFSERGGEPQAPAPLDIAVIGMSCMFPGAPDLASFGATVVGGVDTITEVSPDRWDPAIYYAPDGADGTSASKWGGFLPDIPFDALRYGIPPTALSSIEPVQLLALEAAWRSLVDAGYGERVFDRSRTSVIFGAESGSDLSSTISLRACLPGYLGELPAALDAQLPKLTEDSFPGMLANVIAGRIANRLGLGGANYTVDAACASSLAAVDAACRELALGTSDVVLCGGADLHNGIGDYLLFSSVHALSPTGRSRSFDDSADGIVLGEGVACVVLKRLADAERDGDRIYAVIKGVGRSSDGRSMGLTAPRPQGQRLALERAYRNAGISPAEVGLLEAHGTGTMVGDRTELAVLTDVFTDAGANPGGCVLGSVKSQIGHTKCAAGMAGLIKTALALRSGVLPPTLHVTRPNSGWDAESSPFVFHAAARPWAAAPAQRVAGVSAFGFGGTNFHVVLRAYEGGAPSKHALDEWPAELFTFRGADRQAATREVERLLKLVDADEPWRLRDVALAASRRSDSRAEPVRIAVVASDLEQLRGLLRRAITGEDDPSGGVFVSDPEWDRDGAVAFLFPGQGSQSPGMLAELMVTFPEVQYYLQRGRRWADALYPPVAFDLATAKAQQERITDTRVAQPALGIVGMAAHDLLTAAGVRPDMMAGHSYGELVALCAAGAFTPDTLLELSAARAEAILSSTGADPGAMAAVSAGAREVAEALRAADLADRVVVANQNSPKETVVSGPSAAVDTAVRRLHAAGLRAKRIRVACAFHSPLLGRARERFADVLADTPVCEAEVPVWSNRTAAGYPTHPEQVRSELSAQIDAPVRFGDQVEAMYAEGARVFVEVGPGSVLTGLVSDILGDRPHRTVSCEGGRGLTGFLRALARLATSGVRVDTEWLFQGRDAIDAYHATSPQRPGWIVNGHRVRTVSGAALAGALEPPQRIALGDTVLQQRATVNNGGALGHDREALISQFLRTSQEMVAAQRDVLLSYFGEAPPPRAAAELQAVSAAAEQAPVPPHETVEPKQALVTLSTDDILSAVAELISERTGYPVDMIESDLDLEADLSIDSIKRAEIVGELVGRIIPADTAGVTELDDTELEELSKARTTSAITEWLLARRDDDADARATPARDDGSPDTIAEKPAEQAVRPGAVPKRLLLKEVPLPAGDLARGKALHGKRFVMLGSGNGLAESLATRLAALGADTVTREATHRIGEPDGHVDGVWYLDGLSDTDTPVLPESFPVFRAALLRNPEWLVAVRSAAAEPDDRTAGLRGLFRALSREYPDTTARLVEVDPRRAPDALAEELLAELLAEDRIPVVRRCDGVRHGFDLVEAGLGPLGATGAGPAGDCTAEASALGLDRESVVLLIGGARGITARFAATLAAASRCRLELVGRTAAPVGPEDPAIAAATDRAALRAALIAQGRRSAADIERTVGEISAQREIGTSLEELRELGSDVRYHSLDVHDAEGVHRLVKDIHSEHGRLDGLVYAAGVIEDKLVADKDLASFQRVFGTKVDGARELLDAVQGLPNGPRFAVLFGSIAAVLGNRGQADYAAANDALQSLGSRWAARTGRRALTVHWGPWAPVGPHGGMVSPELGREYVRRGIELIDPEEGALGLLRELAWGEPAVDTVVYTASGW
ncbi:type I polyketide synthase [Nocardia terpenica]|uniref:Polyketide synthase n=1 Tax=Nocardia terpenica TaxID=455432 RepID=A0A164L0C8_9NOCA|nr:type I polyketide synthase [Nocardia terpenica]KZM71905.1 polyketide synthase [Nocardia terpenica]NQE86531.1 type I polyketide synthase [Nocardia terpenica]